MDMTIQNVLDTIIATIPGAPFPKTVDVVKTGDPSQKVTGIVTTMFATVEVIRQAVKLGANLIITHEPTFYNHLDKVRWLKDDPVYQSKRRLIDEHHIVIWRFHDYWHSHQPDGIGTGVLKTLGWEAYVEPEKPFLVKLPPMPLRELVKIFKDRLGIRAVRVVGNLEMSCSRIGLMLGACPGQWNIRILREEKVDVLAVGESAEWETAEYMRDAIALGQKKALVVLGHANSEEPGMSYLVEWLKPRVPGVPVTFVAAGEPFKTV